MFDLLKVGGLLNELHALVDDLDRHGKLLMGFGQEPGKFLCLLGVFTQAQVAHALVYTVQQFALSCGTISQQWHVNGGCRDVSGWCRVVQLGCKEIDIGGLMGRSGCFVFARPQCRI